MPTRTADLSPSRVPPSVPGVGVLGLALALAIGSTACDDDVGACCEVLDPALSDRIPTSTVSSTGNPTSDIALDPAFDCESLICVAYRGTRAFCTARCFEDAECPEGFTCGEVLEASPGPDSEIQPADRFCVRERHDCAN